MYPPTKPTTETSYDQLQKQFIADATSQLGTLTGEIALRNRHIMENDSYVYGDLLARSLKVEAGHDFTPVNWLRRTVEVHRTQTMGAGFTVVSSYHGLDPDKDEDPQAKQNTELLNQKKKSYAGKRNELIQSILRDNGGESVFANMVENASAIGTSVLKAWYDPDEGKYCLDMIEAVEHFYSLWERNNFRESTMDAYVYQINKSDAVKDYSVASTVATSPLGHPLVVLSSANTVEYISTQPMVTFMEITGQGSGLEIYQWEAQ